MHFVLDRLQKCTETDVKVPSLKTMRKTAVTEFFFGLGAQKAKIHYKNSGLRGQGRCGRRESEHFEQEVFLVRAEWGERLECRASPMRLPQEMAP